MARHKKGRGRSPDRGGSGGGAGAGAGTSKPGSSGFGGFLKKRAPIYLGLVALFLVFVIPELTKGGLEDTLPELAADDRRVVDALMGYSGPDGSGHTMMDAISDKITEEFGDKIYDHKDTAIEIAVSPFPAEGGRGSDGGEAGAAAAAYEVSFVVDTHKGGLDYVWTVDVDSGRVTSDDPASKHVVDVVNFYD